MLVFNSFITASAALAYFSGINAAVLVGRNGEPAQPSCTDYTPYIYSGCYTDPAGTEGALLYKWSAAPTQNMTVMKCTAFCKGNDYRYAGLEYYGQCYCGASVLGVATDESKCNYPCTGDKTEACGGSNIISVYSDPTFPTVDPTVISSYKPLGCYSETTSGRTLAWPQSQIPAANMTVNKCLSACRVGGFDFAGVEYGRECYCGVVMGNGTQPLSASTCNMPCKGDATQTCGGRSALNLYVATDMESTEPCKAGPYPSSASSSTAASSTTSKSSTYSPSIGSSTTSSTSSIYSTSSTSSSTTQQTSSTSSTSSSSSTSTTSTTSSETSTTDTTSSSTTSSSGYTTSTTSTTSSTSTESSSTATSTSTTSTASSTSTATSTSSATSTTSTESSTSTSTSSTSTSETSTSSYPTTSSTSSIYSTPTTDSSSSSSTSTSTSSYPTTSSTYSTPTTASSSTSTSSYPTTSSTSSTSSTISTTSSTYTTPTTSSSSSSSSSTSSYPTTSSSSSSSSSASTSSSLTTSSTSASTSTLSTYATTRPTTTSTSSTYPITSSTTSSTSTSNTYPTTTTSPTSSRPTSSPTITISSTTASLCTKLTTVTPTPTCEYKCGNWCSSPMPDFSDSKSCGVAAEWVAVQVASCFLNAGWPENLKCFDFAGWCTTIKTYCSSSCPGKYCSKSSCKSKNPPVNPNPAPVPTPSVSTSIYTCTPTSAAATTPYTSTTVSSCVPVPTSTNICTQPSNYRYGYSNDSPLGDVPMPCLTCNNLRPDYNAGNIFKLYTSPDTNSCRSYKKPSISDACEDACDAQYSSCKETYSNSCKSNSIWAIWFGGKDSYDSANAKCYQQWKDCYAANKQPNTASRCGSWNSGWS